MSRRRITVMHIGDLHRTVAIWNKSVGDLEEFAARMLENNHQSAQRRNVSAENVHPTANPFARARQECTTDRPIETNDDVIEPVVGVFSALCINFDRRGYDFRL